MWHDFQEMPPPTAARKLLGKILEEMRVVSAVQIKTALKKQMTESGKYLEIHRREPDGTWVILRDMFSADSKMPH